MGVVDFLLEAGSAQPSGFHVRLSIISNVRFLRESLADVLSRQGRLSVLGLFDNLQEASRGIVVNQPDIVLLDEAFPDGPMAVRRIRDFIPQIPVVVIAAAETPVEIIAWAEAGVGGYIPRTAGIADVVPRLIGIMRDCSESGAAGLLRRISNVGATNGEHRNTSLPPMLTPREAQIVQMIFLGMSNKDIARHLNIGLATTKTHVHHLLGKLNLQRRGQAASWMREHVHHW